MRRLRQLPLRLVLVAEVLWTSLAFAQQETGRIEGSVTLVDGTPLAAVTVRIGETNAIASTDEHGRFSFPRVAAGTYELAHGWAAFHDLKLAVGVSAGGSEGVAGSKVCMPRDLLHPSDGL